MKKATFVILCLEGAVLSFNVAAIAALVPAIAKDFALSQFIVGKIIWLYMLPYGVAALIYGPLIRAFDAKQVELICIFFFSLANLVAGLSKNISTLFVARFFMGLFGASVIPLALILIARHIEGEKRAKSVGIFFSATFVASLLGLFLSGIVPWRLIFFIPGVLGLILSLLICFFLPSFQPDTEKFRIKYLDVLRDRKIVYIFTYIFLISLLYHGIQQWLGVYFSTKFNFNQFLISLLITLTSLSGIFGEALGGWLADAFGRFKIANLGTSLLIVSVFLLILKVPFVILVLLMIFWGIGWTFNHVAVSTMLTDLPKNFLNEAASLNSSVRFISGGIGAVIGGLFMQRSFNFAFVILGLGLILLRLFSKHLLIAAKGGEEEWRKRGAK